MTPEKALNVMYHDDRSAFQTYPTPFGPGAICSCCGAETALRKFPCGVSVVLENSPRPELVDNCVDGYLVKHESFKIKDNLYLNSRYLITTDVDRKQIDRDDDNTLPFHNAIDVCTSTSEDVLTLTVSSLCYYLAEESYSKSNFYYDKVKGYVTETADVSRKAILEKFKERLKGKYLYIIGVFSHAEQDNELYGNLIEQLNSAGFKTVYKSPMFNNRTHEEDDNYLQAFLLKD